MLNYQNVSAENVGTVDFKIAEAAKRLELQKMNLQQLTSELQIAQKRLAELMQEKTRITETVMYQEFVKNGKAREEAEKKVAVAIKAACEVLEEIVQDIEDALNEKFNSKTTKTPDKASEKTPVHSR